MSDLISRSALLKYFEEEKERIKIDSEKYHIHEEAVAGMEAALQAITNKVNEMPTAYDIEKIVEELETLRIDKCNYFGVLNVVAEKYDRANEMLDNAIDIARKGGVE